MTKFTWIIENMTIIFDLFSSIILAADYLLGQNNYWPFYITP